MNMITEQVESLRTLADIAKDIADNSTDTVKTLREAADTIEQLAAKVREDNAYQKAFEDIRAEFIRWIEMDGGSYEYDKALKRGLNIVDKHDPAKMKSEGKE